jgi:hypothetical protein
VKGFEPSASGATTRHSNQLSYTHHSCLVRLEGFELSTHGLEVRCSIQLSYRRLSSRRTAFSVFSKKAVYRPFTAFCQDPNALISFYRSTDESGYSIEAVSLLGEPFSSLVGRVEMAAQDRIEPTVELSCTREA